MTAERFEETRRERDARILSAALRAQRNLRLTPGQAAWIRKQRGQGRVRVNDDQGFWNWKDVPYALAFLAFVLALFFGGFWLGHL